MSTRPSRIECHASLPSTNDRAIARASAGEGPWVAVLAETQTAGRGRHGRTWASPPGNLYLSVVLDPTVVAPGGGLGLIAAVASAETVASMLGNAATLTLKWPNDLMVDGRKLGGVLVEAGSRPDGSRWAVAGIGLNLVLHPGGEERPATSLAALGVVPPVPEVLAEALIDALIAWSERARRDGFAAIIDAWQRHAGRPGSPITVRLPAGPIHGHYAGLCGDGALLVRLDDGGVRRIVSGEVFAGG